MNRTLSENKMGFRKRSIASLHAAASAYTDILTYININTEMWVNKLDNKTKA
jgi:hypothetical protein